MVGINQLLAAIPTGYFLGSTYPRKKLTASDLRAENNLIVQKVSMLSATQRKAVTTKYNQLLKTERNELK